MVRSTLLPILLLTGWSAGVISSSSVTRSSTVEQHENTAPPAHPEIGNQALPGLSTGVLDANSLSSSPSSEADKADETAKPTTTEAEPAETTGSPASDSDSGASDPLKKPESAILGGASKVTDGAKTATEGPDATSKSPSSSSDFNLLPTDGSKDPSGDISNFLKGASGLFSPSLLPDLEEAVHDAAHLLKGQTTPHTKTLLESAYQLLNPNTVSKITSAAHTAEGIITPELIDELKKVHLAEVFDDVGYLYSKGKKVLGSAKGLLSENVIQNIEDIIDGVKKLLSGGSVDDIQNILDKAEGLLPPEVTNSLRTALSNIGPLVDKVKPLAEKAEHFLSQTDFSHLGELGKNVESLIGTIATVVTPEHIKKIEDGFNKAKPYVGKVQDYLSHADWNRFGALAKNAEGLISTLASAVTPEHVKQIESLADKAKPYAEKVWDYLADANWDRVSDLANNVEDLVGNIASVVTPENIKKVEDAFNNVKDYFTPATMDKARDLVSSVWSILTPEGIDRIGSLLGKANALLTPATMDKARDLVSSVWSILTPEGIDRIGSLLGKANALLTPDFFDQAKNVFGKLRILYNSIAPGITPPTFDRLGGLLDTVLVLLTPKFANETSSLIGTASGVLTPQLVNEVDGYLHSAEKMFTPDVRNDTVSVLDSAVHILPSISSFIQSLY